VCSAQPTVMALNAIAARVDLVRFIFTLLYQVDFPSTPPPYRLAASL
jgi:hypothetical protein